MKWTQVSRLIFWILGWSQNLTSTNPPPTNNAVSVVTDPFDDRYQTACFWGSVEPSLLWQTFAILTPCNPGGITVKDTVNIRLIEDFVHEIRSQELPSIWMMVGSPDGLHQETACSRWMKHELGECLSCIISCHSIQLMKGVSFCVRHHRAIIFLSALGRAGWCSIID